ncbi:hypothetical protein NXT3_PB00378 (plasmid) [Sinorhizobium fredii]|uniref:Uncharacterized protein n=1 Tax=Rhizobium fredii TaxID=380 RepID=A0A2L0HC20_RHIFR|nr:hypothetical protein NXT3_PB00378 [Sinorhizobium fredii]
MVRSCVLAADMAASPHETLKAIASLNPRLISQADASKRMITDLTAGSYAEHMRRSPQP